MAFDHDLAERIGVFLLSQSEVIEKKMFGGLAFLLNGNLLVGIVKDRLMARIGAENYDNALQQPYVRKMDFNGKPMKGYVFVEPHGLKLDSDLEKWISMSVKFVENLPAKSK